MNGSQKMGFTAAMRAAGRFVAYSPTLAKPLGGVKACLLFCQLLYWKGSENFPELGVYKTVDEIEHETGLTYKEQMSARRILREKGVLVETEKRFEHRIYYKIDEDKTDELLWDFANPQKVIPRTDQTSVREMPKGQSAKSHKGVSVYKKEDIQRIPPQPQQHASIEVVWPKLVNDEDKEKITLHFDRLIRAQTNFTPQDLLDEMQKRGTKKTIGNTVGYIRKLVDEAVAGKLVLEVNHLGKEARELHVKSIEMRQNQKAS